ncbi:MAG: polysaccharide biosynthesis/export family protein [Acidobacteriaceae bacterium]
MLALSSLTSGHAQLPSRAAAQSADPLEACEAPLNEEYRLGFGDQISVDVNNDDPKLSAKRTVGPDGRITLGLAGSINVAGSTRDEAAASIRTALARFYTPPPTVVVGVDVYTSDYVTVMGAVEHPGPMTFDQPPSLLTVISRAGMAPALNVNGIQSNPSAVPDRVALFCGNQTIAWEDFRQLLEDGRPEIQRPLRRNIVIYVPSPNDRYVSVFGMVLRPGVVQLRDGSTLAQILAAAGGIVTDKAGRLPKIQIIHEYKGSIETVPYENILEAKSDQKISLQTGDIIYVPESTYSRFGVTLEKLSPLISIGTVGALIAHP